MRPRNAARPTIRIRTTGPNSSENNCRNRGLFLILLSAYFPKRTLFLGISEACLVAIAFVVAAIARLGADDATVMLNYEQGYLKILIVSATFILCMYYFDLYKSSILSNRREVLSRLIHVPGTVCILLACVYYVYPPLGLGRGIFVIGFVFVALLLFLWRRLFLIVNSAPQFAERALIFGDGPLAKLLVRELEVRPELGLRVVTQILADSNGKNELKCEDPEPTAHHVASAEDGELSWAVKFHRVNRIVIAMGDRRGKLPVELLLSLKSRGVVVQDGTHVYEAITGKVPIESLRLGWLLFSPGFQLSRFLLIYKRLASLVISIMGLLKARRK